MKKIGIFLLIACYLFVNMSICAVATDVESTATDPIEETIEGIIEDTNSAVSSGSFSLDALNPLLGSEMLVENTRSAIVYEANSQTLLYAWNPDTQMYPASLVKLLTALIAIKQGTLSDVVTVTGNAIASVSTGAVTANLLAGEMLSLENLLHCMLLGSANDAASVIAEHISGSQNAFVSEMNRYASELGCTASQFTNPHGLHDENQHTTARDVAKILDAALKDPVFRTIFAANEYTVPATNMSAERVLVSGNSMKDTTSKLYYDPRVIGGRTGVSQDGRRCLATAAESNGMLVISVVMGAESVYQEDGYSAISIGGYKETTQLFDRCLTGYKTAQILRSEQILRQIPVDGAENDLLIGSQTSVSTVLPEDITAQNLTFRYADKPLSLPIEKGQHVSDVEIWNGPMCVAQAQLYAMNSLYAPSRISDDENKNQTGAASGAVLVIVIIIVLVTVTFLMIRFGGSVKHFIIRINKKRRRRSRKRFR